MNAKVNLEDFLYATHPDPLSRAALCLATALNEAGPKQAAVSWALQQEAVAYANEHGLARTLERILELGGEL